jgi:hypothetical protein
VFAVLRASASATAGSRSLLGASGSAVYPFFGTSGKLWSTTYTSASVRNGATWLSGAPVDGTLVAWPTTMSVLSVVASGDVPADRLGNDADNNSPWPGDVVELLVFTAAPSDAQRRALERYLESKYRPYAVQAAAPLLTPNGGAFDDPLLVTLASASSGAELRFTLDGAEPTPASTLYAAPLELSATTTLRARAYRSDLMPSPISTATFLLDDAFRPSDLAGLALWLRADAGVTRDAGERVSGWTNQAPPPAPPLGPNDVLPASALALPQLTASSTGGLPALRFDGGDDHLLLARSVSNARTVFWVVFEDWRAGGANANRYLLGGPSGSTLEFCGGWSSLWLSGTASASVTGGSTRFDGAGVNGSATPRPWTPTVISLVTTGDVGFDRLMRHAGHGQPWWGELAEIVVYDRALTAAEVQQVETYLGGRYGITVQP